MLIGDAHAAIRLAGLGMDPIKKCSDSCIAGL